MNSLKPEPKKKTKTTASRGRALVAPGDGKPRYIGVDLHKQTPRFTSSAVMERRCIPGSSTSLPRPLSASPPTHLRSTDNLAVEVTSNTWAFVRMIRPHVAKVVVSNPLKTKAIAEANVKTDKVDARVLARPPAVRLPPERLVAHAGDEDNRCSCRHGDRAGQSAHRHPQPDPRDAGATADQPSGQRALLRQRARLARAARPRSARPSPDRQRPSPARSNRPPNRLPSIR